MLEIDKTSSFGTVDIRLSDMFTNAAEVVWNAKTGASIFFRCNCTSTAFAPNKHGGEKGTHMRFQIDTYELITNSLKYHSNLILSSFYPSSSLSNNLSPSNSSSLSSSSSPSSSSFLSNEFKMAKDEFDCISSTSDFNKNIQQQQEKEERFQSPSPLIDYSTGNYWKHIGSSYCRIQLFRLKGAQRKLKTDKSKVERLNPPDLRKRYQASNKMTVLCNSQFDSLYSLLPFNRYVNNMPSNSNTIRTTTPDDTIDNCITNIIDHRSLPMDYNLLNNNNSTNNNSFFLNNSNLVSSTSLLPLYSNNNNNENGDVSQQVNSVNNSYTIQPILVQQQQQQQQQVPHMTKLKQNLLNENSSINRNDQSDKIIQASSISSMSSLSSSASSTSSNDEAGYFLETNHTFFENHAKSNGSEINNSQMSVLVNNTSNDENSINTYGEDQVYTRLKRASSISSINSNASYGSNNCLNYNYKCPKFQKTSSMSSVQQNQQQQQQIHQQQSLNRFINLSPNYSTMTHPSSPGQPHVFVNHQSSSPSSSKQAYIQLGDQSKIVQSQMSVLSSASVLCMDQNNSSTTSTNLFRSKTLPNDCNYKFVQDWLIVNRFSHLLPLFSNYTSNDILRLSKEDMINLCGAPDGIRCFNMAHNIQIKPKLTIFVTFQNQTYFSAIFLVDWKNKYLIKKLLSLYSNFIADLSEKTNEDKTEIDNTVNSKDPIKQVDESEEINTECTESNRIASEKNKSYVKIPEHKALEHQLLHEKMIESKLDYELFLKIKDILVQTTDEVLNNLSDQSRFLIKFEIPSFPVAQNNTMSPSSYPSASSSSIQPPQSPSSRTNSKFSPNNLIKILMIPLDQSL